MRPSSRSSAAACHPRRWVRGTAGPAGQNASGGGARRRRRLLGASRDVLTWGRAGGLLLLGSPREVGTGGKQPKRFPQLLLRPPGGSCRGRGSREGSGFKGAEHVAVPGDSGLSPCQRPVLAHVCLRA